MSVCVCVCDGKYRYHTTKDSYMCIYTSTHTHLLLGMCSSLLLLAGTTDVPRGSATATWLTALATHTDHQLNCIHTHTHTHTHTGRRYSN